MFFYRLIILSIYVNGKINFQDILGGGDNLDFYFSQQAVLGGVA